jgi:hypothetical protein
MNPYNPIHSEEWLNNFLRRKFRKKTYTPFHWWRNYKPKRKPLPPRSTTLDKIKNGDFDQASYIYEIELIEYKLKRSYDKFYPDINRILEENSIDLARIKRLKEDVAKDEQSKLDHLYKCLWEEFGWKREEAMDKLENTKGETLLQVYKNLKKQYL